MAQQDRATAAAPIRRGLASLPPAPPQTHRASLAVRGLRRGLEMRKTLLRTLVVAAVAALLVVAGAAQAITLRVGDIVITGDGGFTPTTLPKNENAPIKLYGHAKVRDHRRHPALAAAHADARIRQARRGRDARPRKMHDGETGRDDDEAGAQALPGRDRRHRASARRWSNCPNSGRSRPPRR